jgi:hypothetical protein
MGLHGALSESSGVQYEGVQNGEILYVYVARRLK